MRALTAKEYAILSAPDECEDYSLSEIEAVRAAGFISVEIDAGVDDDGPYDAYENTELGDMALRIHEAYLRSVS